MQAITQQACQYGKGQRLVYKETEIDKNSD